MKNIKVNLKSKRYDEELKMFMTFEVPISQLPTLFDYLSKFKRTK